uniref:Uncharacterized protein n=1 Tax=Chromera velia CCMP2878 TaxID=1169474 RepID=A0A0G4HU78_9ALVE|eukprot:Cvel_8561.t1-p1 / transcript=Cvel_8561.t1 / gene=Cvel_8561 / organism=Chromera_velia_CCMP2878 / gene_product=hypothetical protein / transcript_product=hypothetical protein / location=Cvel_scaffold475:19853-23603(-) / protein_length=80 / sequence_SO=supercontig / SO=protein_coding / is_pseudo=false
MPCGGHTEKNSTREEKLEAVSEAFNQYITYEMESTPSTVEGRLYIWENGGERGGLQVLKEHTKKAPQHNNGQAQPSIDRS